MTDATAFPENNTVVVAIEQWEGDKLLSRREPIRYPNLPNMTANQLNILLSEGVDAGILPEIEALRDAKAAMTGQTELVEQMDPLLQARRYDRQQEYVNKKSAPGQTKKTP